jgi:hypothetical protein
MKKFFKLFIPNKYRKIFFKCKDKYLLKKAFQKQNCIFIHVPKVAGTSLTELLYGRHFGHHKAIDLEKRYPSLFRATFKFAFVRNPWDRVLSSYLFAKNGGTQDTNISEAAKYEIPEFDTFQQFVKEWLVNQDLETVDPVFKRQSDFLFKDGILLVDFVGRLENFSEDVKLLEKKLSIKLDVPHKNKTVRTMHYSEYYDEESIKLITDLYKEDILNFTYEFHTK